jgi:uncharacterized protein YybS (DUF2232 family)
MFRKLNAIEIAEGALLADIAVVFQLLVIYLPVGGDFLRMIIMLVFTIIVLRRGLYVGIMALGVALFMVGMVVGPQNLPIMVLQCCGGLFLGVTMKYRFRHIPLLLLGITGGALSFYAFLFIIWLFAGLPAANIAHGLQRLYQGLLFVAGLIASHVGLAHWWKQSLYPLASSLATLIFTYWWLAFYIALWLAFCPIVTIVYTVTNLYVRLLGYDVRPFPDGKINWLLHRLIRRLIKMRIRRRIMRRSGAKA